MKIEELKMNKTELNDTLEGVIDNLSEDNIRDWLKWMINTQSKGTKETMLKYWNNTEELKRGLEYSGIIES